MIKVIMKIKSRQFQKHVLFFFCLMFIWMTSQVSADTAASSNNFVYNFHLYYDNGQLLADRDFEFEYDLTAEEYVPEIVSAGSSYRGEIVNILGRVAATFYFDPKQGNPKFTKGKTSIKGPYFADASEVNFYSNKNQLLLTLDLSGSSFCNDDGTCNSDVGENYQNCPNDCPRPSPSPTSAISPPGFFGLGLPKLILILAGAVLAAVVIWKIWAIIKKRKADEATLPTSGTSLPGF